MKIDVPTLIVALTLLVVGRVVISAAARRLASIARNRGEALGRVAQNAQRAQALRSLTVSVGNVVLVTVSALMALTAFGINTAALVTSAGVIGLAIGFGSQAVVKDFISGLLILLEGQYNIGDRVKIGSAEGEVIRVTARSTVLRNKEGNTFYIANGSVDNVINYSQANVAPTEEKSAS